jgi:hypothetical protein
MKEQNMFILWGIYIQNRTDICQIYLLHKEFFGKLPENSVFTTDLGSLMILPPTCSKYCGQFLVVNSQFWLTVNTPFLQDAVSVIFRIKQLVAVYTASVRHC